MLKTYLFAYLMIAFCCQALAQSDTTIQAGTDLPNPQIVKYYPKSRMVSLNMMPLLTQLVPFNSVGTQVSGPFQMRFKNYKRKNRAFRFGVGVLIDPVLDDETDENTSFVNLQIGFEFRKNISERWSYTRGFDVLFLAGRQNISGQSLNESSSGLGIGFPWGIEYALAPRVTLSTEAELMLVIGDFPSLVIVPPVGLFLNYYFSKKATWQ